MASEPAPAGDFRRDYAGIAEKWAKGVVSGAVVAGKLTKLACKRHLGDLKRSKKAGWAYYFDSWHAGDICDFIEKLPHVQGNWCTCPNGKRGEHLERCGLIDLEAPQIFILAVIFGWRRHDDARRRFAYAYIEMARKGAKSTLTAGVALYCLSCEDEVGPEIYVGATTGAQALKVFAPAQAMARKTPDLLEAFGLQVWAKSIVCQGNSGFIQTVNSKGSTNDGHNPHLAILDELHAHKERSLFDVMQSGMGARSNPLMWVITTAGFNTHGICYEQRTYVQKVLEGSLEGDHVFGIIFTIDEGDDPYDEKVWAKANPMLGVTPRLTKMREYARDAKASPAAEGNFKTKNLNIWLNAASAWLNAAQWKACADTNLSWEDFDGLDCWIGGDLADKDDITALVLAAFRPHPDFADQVGLAACQLIIKPMFWLPAAVLEQADHAQGRGPAPYRSWAEHDYLQLTPGDWVDHNAIEAVIRGWDARYAIQRGTFDQFAAAQAMASRLNEDRGEATFEILHKKASAVTNPAKELEARVKAGPRRLLHDGNPVMNWMASNVVVERRVDETIIPKKESKMSPNKIDGIDALVNAIAPAVSVVVDEDAPVVTGADILMVM
ncbi:MAG: terminase large subunit [Caulobacteraceae bacterium]